MDATAMDWIGQGLSKLISRRGLHLLQTLFFNDWGTVTFCGRRKKSPSPRCVAPQKGDRATKTFSGTARVFDPERDLIYASNY